jgi:hypothetical protein
MTALRVCLDECPFRWLAAAAAAVADVVEFRIGA